MKIKKITNGGGGDKAPSAPPPAAAAPAPVTTDTGPDPAMQAEIERQRALRFKAGAQDTTGSDQTTTGSDTETTTAKENTNKTLLGQ